MRPEWAEEVATEEVEGGASAVEGADAGLSGTLLDAAVNGDRGGGLKQQNGR